MQSRLDAVAADSGPAAVALSERATDRREHPGGDGPASQRVGTDDHANGAGAVVERDTESIGQLIRSPVNGPGHRHSDAFVSLRRSPGGDRQWIRKRGGGARVDPSLRDPQCSLREAAPHRTFDRDGQPSRPAARDGLIEIERDPARSVLDEACTAGFERAERRRQDTFDPGDRPVRQRPNARDRNRLWGRGRRGSRDRRG